MTAKTDSIAQGVSVAFYDWLHEHTALTMPDIMDLALGKAFRDWLDANGDDLIAAIADKARPDIRATVPAVPDPVEIEQHGALHIAYELVAEGQKCSACGERVPPRQHPDFVLKTDADRRVCMRCAHSSHEGHYDAVNTLQHVRETFANLLPEPSEDGAAWDYLRTIARGAALLLADEQF